MPANALPLKPKLVWIDGTLMRVSDPRTFTAGDGKNSQNFYYLGLKTTDNKRVMVYLSTNSMGWGGDINKSKIWYHHEVRKREIKTSLMNPTKFIGKRMRIQGNLETLDAPNRKYRMNRVVKLVLYV